MISEVLHLLYEFKEAYSKMHSVSYAEHSFAGFARLQVPADVIQREVLLALIYRVYTGENWGVSSWLRLERRYRNGKTGLPDGVRGRTGFLSEKDCAEIAVKHFKAHEVDINVVHPGLVFASDLKTEAGQDLVIAGLKGVAISDWHSNYLIALTQLAMYRADGLEEVLDFNLKVSNAEKLRPEAYEGTAKIIFDGAELSDQKRIDYLARLYAAQRPENSKALYFLIQLAKTNRSSIPALAKSIPSVQSLVDIGGLRSEEVVAMMGDFEKPEILVALREVMASGKLDAEITRFVLTQPWDREQANQLGSLFYNSEDPAVPDLLLESAPVIYGMARPIARHYLFKKAQESKSKLGDAAFVSEIAGGLESGNLAKDRGFTEVAAIMELGVNSGSKELRGVLIGLLDEGHPLYSNYGEGYSERAYAAVLREIGNCEGLAIDAEVAIIDGLKSMEEPAIHVAVSLALKSWPEGKPVSEDLRQAICANLLGAEAIFNEKEPFLMMPFFTDDPDTNTSVQVQILQFIEKGGAKRIKEYAAELEQLAKSKREEVFPYGKSSIYAVKLLKEIE